MTDLPKSHIPFTHPSDGTVYVLSHLDHFQVELAGKGKRPGESLFVNVYFSNHVYSERVKLHNDPFHILDHHGSKRVFDIDRFNSSIHIPGEIQKCLNNNELVKKSKSFGGNENLIFFRDFSGNSWIIVICFYPENDENTISLHVLSTHQKDDRDNGKKEAIHASARTCLFKNTRYPEEK